MTDTRTDQDINDYKHLIGKNVRKSKKPFKSGEKVNTVYDIVLMSELSDKKNRIVYGATFVEDDSIVEVERLRVV